MRRSIQILCLCLLLSPLGSLALDPTHAAFTEILKEHVDGNGMVDYAALKRDPAKLDAYLDTLAAVPRTGFDAWDEPDRIAFLVNLYNAATLRLIVDHVPVSSIRKIGGRFGSPWKQKVVRVWGQTITLDDVEHGILRKEYDEPRIHFALVCAARSCPPLRREAFTGARLDEQLRDQGRVFMAETTKNRVDVGGNTLYLSKIFDWFTEDFTQGGSTLEKFVAPYVAGPAQRAAVLSGKLRIRFTDYDWSLNEQK